MSEIIPRQSLAAWVAPGVDTPLEGEDQRHGVLRHRVGIDAGGVGEADVVRAQHLLVVLIDAGADRLDELEALGGGRHLVLPHHGDHHHVGLGDPRGHVLGLPHLEMGDAGVARRKAAGHLVGAMGKADVEAVFWWEHVGLVLLVQKARRGK
jgi:hypothetical protein